MTRLNTLEFCGQKGWWCWLGLLLGLWWAPGAFADETLIFSETHESEAAQAVEAPQGTLSVTISAFEPLQLIKVNGQTQDASGDFVQLEVPYQVEQGPVEIEIEAHTASGVAQRTYRLHLKPPAESLKRFDWSLISLLTHQWGDNLTNAAKGETVGFRKTSVILMPAFSLTWEDMQVELKGLSLREKLADAAQAANEVVYDQWELHHKWKLGAFNFDSSLGLAEIATELKGWSGKSHLESDQYLSEQMVWELTEGQQLTGTLKAKSKSLAEADPASYSLSGLETQGDLGYQIATDLLRINASMRHKKNDALGTYQDFSEDQAGLGFEAPILEGLTYNLNLTQGRKRFAQVDAAKGQREIALSTEAALGASGAMPWVAGWQWMSELSQGHYDSNIDGSDYQTLAASVSLLYVF